MKKCLYSKVSSIIFLIIIKIILIWFSLKIKSYLYATISFSQNYMTNFTANVNIPQLQILLYINCLILSNVPASLNLRNNILVCYKNTTTQYRCNKQLWVSLWESHLFLHCWHHSIFWVSPNSWQSKFFFVFLNDQAVYFICI